MGVCTNSHLWSFGLVLSIEELRQGSSLNLMDASSKEKQIGKSNQRFGFINDLKNVRWFLVICYIKICLTGAIFLNLRVTFDCYNSERHNSERHVFSY